MESGRLLRRLGYSVPHCLHCRPSSQVPSITTPRRHLTITPERPANENTPEAPSQRLQTTSNSRTSKDTSLGSISSRLFKTTDNSPNKSKLQRTSNSESTLSGFSASLLESFSRNSESNNYSDTISLHNLAHPPPPPPPHHLHVYSTRHNTHLTLTRPDRNPIISISTGNIGFRKANRGTYDAAYQLGAYVMSRIQDQGLLTEIQKLELVLRGFGPGREAMTKILLGSEGMHLRPTIVKVTDATRLKFGGTRSKKPRRLG